MYLNGPPAMMDEYELWDYIYMQKI